jgi:hypothetical protein
MALQEKGWRASLEVMFHQADLFGSLVHRVYSRHCLQTCTIVSDMAMRCYTTRTINANSSCENTTTHTSDTHQCAFHFQTS